VRMMCAAALAMAAALCGAQQSPTSAGEAADASTSSTTTTPATIVPPPVGTSTMPAAVAGPPPPAPGPAIDFALVLPLDTPAYARAADAVRAGFLAAAGAAGALDRCTVIAHGEDGVIGAFDTAKARGARVIVGPLVRDDLKTIAIAAGDWPLTIALNQLDDGMALPPRTYSLALTVESDARVIARRALDDGAKAVDVIEGDSALMRRLASAFAAEWIAGGGAAPAAHAVEPTVASLGILRRTLGKAQPDAVVLAMDGDRAALVKPYLGPVTAYASGLVFERPQAAVARDLDNIRVVEIPWIVAPDAQAFERLPRREVGGAALTRLYALGLDAFRAAQAFVDAVPDRLELDGAIGHLVLGENRQFQREGRLAVYRDGQLVPLDPTR
jgi:outer membrane PBP1 activator LpoA protein